MASTITYLEFVLEQLSQLDDIKYCAVMGEYIIYYRGKIIGGIYDNRFLIKPTESAFALMPLAEHISPYKGAKTMLLVDNIDDRDFMANLLNTIYDELPTPRVKKKGS